MNDPIKYMLTAAGIAIVSATAGGILVGWTMTGMKGEELRVKSAKPSTVSGQTTVHNSPNGNWLPSPAAFQKAQDLPEVKLAKDEFMAAQSRYIATIRSALENPTNAAKIRDSLPPGTPLSITPPTRFTGTNKVVQRTVTSGQKPVVSGQGAVQK